MSKKQNNKFSPEVRERAVRLVQEHRDEYRSQWAAVQSIAPKIGCSAYTLLKWVQLQEVEAGMRAGVPQAEQERIKALEREVKELRRANEVLTSASAVFAQAALDRELKKYTPISISIGVCMGSSRSARSCRLPRQPTGDMPLDVAIRNCEACGPRRMSNTWWISSVYGSRTFGFMEPVRSGSSSSGKA